ncbi:FAD-binding dehydrogenase [Actibacterium sp. 188UL27-1]|uniref:FAD-binding dehydrogenase n=1 Tax=Actibacterium sp. 188UL27-1 TaxID=2786961 RepID=UPI0019576390|nr:FAD-binding dehydrogenase [Actibacterium sp. 188UL27-1]MBM7068411.1 FAD-binding dehydrogenase [Actibacterium sp. 188UL27-1]
MEQADVIVVGGGLAGLVAAAELADRGKSVSLIDQEPDHFLGGQAFWSLGGLMLVNSPEQRRMGIVDSRELAMSDWMGSAQFDRDEDHWPRKWAEAFIDFSAGGMRGWLHGLGMRWFPIVGWAERGGAFASGHGNSVPRFHLTWGVGPGTQEPFERRVRDHAKSGRITLKFRHRCSHIIMENGAAKGVSGEVLAEDLSPRGHKTNRDIVGDFELRAASVLVTSGGIGGDFDLVRKAWPTDRLGPAPAEMISGVPAHVDGRMVGISQAAGGHVINADRMWHYTEGVKNWDPIWPNHGIRILPGPSSMWFDATGNRFAPPALPGFDSLGTLKMILATGYDYSWFITTQAIVKKEFALSGSEQNPDLEAKSWKRVLQDRVLNKQATPAVEAFKEHGENFVVAKTLEELVAGMNAVQGNDLLDVAKIRTEVEARDAQIKNPFSKDVQMMAIHAARNYRGDRLLRTAKPHRILDPANGPLIAVKLNIITRKTLGGLQTDLNSQMLDASGQLIPGLFAAGEVAGFGGGGYHGYNALEGTFLGGCIFSGRQAGRAETIA